jgi:hypothetical protein
MPVQYKPEIKCLFEECLEEQCPVFRGIEDLGLENLKQLTETLSDEDGLYTTVYHQNDNTVIEGLHYKDFESENCLYGLMAEGPESEEIVKKIKLKFENWKPVEFIEKVKI